MTGIYKPAFAYKTVIISVIELILIARIVPCCIHVVLYTVKCHHIPCMIYPVTRYYSTVKARVHPICKICKSKCISLTYAAAAYKCRINIPFGKCFIVIDMRYKIIMNIYKFLMICPRSIYFSEDLL